jgi:hypothetical protein
MASDLYRRYKPHEGLEVVLVRQFHTNGGKLPAGTTMRVNYVTGRNFSATLATPCKCCSMQPSIHIRLKHVEWYFDL